MHERSWTSDKLEIQFKVYLGDLHSCTASSWQLEGCLIEGLSACVCVCLVSVSMISRERLSVLQCHSLSHSGRTVVFTWPCFPFERHQTYMYTHTHAHTRTHTHSHAHTAPRLSHLVPLAQTAGLTATDKCSWICCCPSLQTGFQRGSVLLPGAPLSSARHPARSKQGKARLCGTKGMDGTARDTRRKHAVRWMCQCFKEAWVWFSVFVPSEALHLQRTSLLPRRTDVFQALCLSAQAATGTRGSCHVNLSWEVWWLLQSMEKKKKGFVHMCVPGTDCNKYALKNQYEAQFIHYLRCVCVYLQ